MCAPPLFVSCPLEGPNVRKEATVVSPNTLKYQLHVFSSLCCEDGDTCNSVLYNLPKNSILRLQRIQIQAARILTKTPRRDHITEVLIEERILYKLLIITFKVFIDRTAPLCLCELIEQQKCSTNTRLANDAFLLKLPPPSRNCSGTFLAFIYLWSPI